MLSGSFVEQLAASSESELHTEVSLALGFLC
jgi:hypothetical protein